MKLVHIVLVVFASLGLSAQAQTQSKTKVAKPAASSTTKSMKAPASLNTLTAGETRTQAPARSQAAQFFRSLKYSAILPMVEFETKSSVSERGISASLKNNATETIGLAASKYDVRQGTLSPMGQLAYFRGNVNDVSYSMARLSGGMVYGINKDLSAHGGLNLARFLTASGDSDVTSASSGIGMQAGLMLAVSPQIGMGLQLSQSNWNGSARGISYELTGRSTEVSLSGTF